MRPGRPRQGGRSVAIATGIRRGPDPQNRVGSLTLGDEIIVLAAVERVELAAAHSGRPRLRPLATIHARSCSRARRQASPQVIHFALVRDHRALHLCCARCVLCSGGQRHEWNFPLHQDFAARNQTGAKRLSRQGSREEDSIAANLPPHSDGKASPLKSGRQNAVVPQMKGGRGER